MQLGKKLTRGLGAGADPTKGRDAALEDEDKIRELLTGSDMVFVTAGLGGAGRQLPARSLSSVALTSCIEWPSPLGVTGHGNSAR